jgi:hypothetical protein
MEEILKALIAIEVKKQLAELLPVIQPQSQRRFYTAKQVAAITADGKGVRKYSEYQIRQACNLGRIKAEKNDSGKMWLISQENLDLILERGLPKRSPN